MIYIRASKETVQLKIQCTHHLIDDGVNTEPFLSVPRESVCGVMSDLAGEDPLYVSGSV